MAADQFIGAWLVSEYVYNPDGTFAGIIHQRRELAKSANGRLRVTQHCQPEITLNKHPMGRFAGVPVFELSIDGRYRRYHGPAVIGVGTTWGDGAMVGKGLWPDFGHNFSSFAVLPTTDCQLTGGKFFNATQMIANIAGVAVPEDETAVYPTLNRDYNPIAPEWAGTMRTLSADGELVDERPLRRTFQTTANGQLIWDEDGKTIALTWDDGRFRNQHSIGKLFGPLLEIETANSDGRFCQQMELLDTVRGHLIGLRRWLQGDNLEKVEVIRLQPNK